MTEPAFSFGREAHPQLAALGSLRNTSDMPGRLKGGVLFGAILLAVVVTGCGADGQPRTASSEPLGSDKGVTVISASLPGELDAAIDTFLIRHSLTSGS